MTDSFVTQQLQPPNDVYGVFVGAIDQLAVGRLANAANVAFNNDVTHIHLAFQTMGGSVADGVALYNLFRAIPTPLTLYNIGSVASAGVIAYLGAATRAASTHARL